MDRNELVNMLLSIRERAMNNGLMLFPADTGKLADIAYQIMDEAGKRQFEKNTQAMINSMTISNHDTQKATLQINGAWYIDNLPNHLVIELKNGNLVMVRMAPFRAITENDFMQYKGYHPRKMKGQPLPDYLYRFYGLERSNETANEVIHVRLTPTEKAKIQTVAENAGKSVSEYIRDWIRSL